MVLCTIVRRNYGRELPASIQGHNLNLLMEGSFIFSSAFFTILSTARYLPSGYLPPRTFTLGHCPPRTLTPETFTLGHCPPRILTPETFTLWQCPPRTLTPETFTLGHCPPRTLTSRTFTFLFVIHQTATILKTYLTRKELPYMDFLKF